MKTFFQNGCDSSLIVLPLLCTVGASSSKLKQLSITISEPKKRYGNQFQWSAFKPITKFILETSFINLHTLELSGVCLHNFFGLSSSVNGNGDNMNNLRNLRNLSLVNAYVTIQFLIEMIEYGKQILNNLRKLKLRGVTTINTVEYAKIMKVDAYELETIYLNINSNVNIHSKYNCENYKLNSKEGNINTWLVDIIFPQLSKELHQLDEIAIGLEPLLTSYLSYLVTKQSVETNRISYLNLNHVSYDLFDEYTYWNKLIDNVPDSINIIKTARRLSIGDPENLERLISASSSSSFPNIYQTEKLSIYGIVGEIKQLQRQLIEYNKNCSMRKKNHDHSRDCKKLIFPRLQMFDICIVLWNLVGVPSLNPGSRYHEYTEHVIQEFDSLMAMGTYYKDGLFIKIDYFCIKAESDAWSPDATQVNKIVVKLLQLLGNCLIDITFKFTPKSNKVIGILTNKLKEMVESELKKKNSKYFSVQQQNKIIQKRLNNSYCCDCSSLIIQRKKDYLLRVANCQEKVINTPMRDICKSKPTFYFDER